MVLPDLLDDMGNEANPCSLPFMHNIVEPDSSEVTLQPDPSKLGGHCLVEVISDLFPGLAEVIAVLMQIENCASNITSPAYLGHMEC